MLHVKLKSSYQKGFKLMRAQLDYNLLAKLVVIGDSGVGKTNILLRFCDNTFEPYHIQTLGVELKIKIVYVEGTKIKMEFWDTSGHIICKQTTPSYYKGAIRFFLVYSVNDKNTFDNIKYWINTIKLNVRENVCIMLIGNKIDESSRQVTNKEGESLAKQFEIQYFKISAKEGNNVTEAFCFITAKLVKTHLLNQNLTQKNQAQNINIQARQQEKTFETQQIQQKQEVYQKQISQLLVILVLCENCFQPSYISTIGSDLKTKTIDEKGKKIKIQIWDFGGSGRFETFTESFYKGGKGIVLVYSVDDIYSFDKIKNWMLQFKKYGYGKICKLLIGNKIDTSNRQVTIKESKTLAKQFGIPFFESSAKQFGVPFFESSAKKGINVVDAFKAMAQQASVQSSLFS